jgi:hypothetical protein
MVAAQREESLRRLITVMLNVHSEKQALTVSFDAELKSRL